MQVPSDPLAGKFITGIKQNFRQRNEACLTVHVLSAVVSASAEPKFERRSGD